MRTTTAIISVFSDPLAGGYLGGWIAIGVGLFLGVPLLFTLGALSIIVSLAVAMVLAR